MASIKCTNCGAVLKTQAEIPPGKKVKCPKCSETFVVQAEEEEKPAPEEEEQDEAAEGEEEEEAPKKKGKPAADEDEDEGEAAEGEDEEEAPKKKGGKKGKKGDEEEAEGDGEKKPKSKTGMIIGIVVGVLLLCCCLPNCGYGIWYQFFQTNVQKQQEDAAKKLQEEMLKAFKDAGTKK